MTIVPLELSRTRPSDADQPAVGLALSSQSVASVRDLHVSFTRGGRQVRALRGVSLDIGRGEILGVVGESGSGKSVFGLSLLGLLPHDPAPTVTGTVDVCGVDVVNGSDPARRGLRRRPLRGGVQGPVTVLHPAIRGRPP